MICVSLGFPTVAECVEALKEVSFAEIRLDLMEVKISEIPLLFSRKKRLIATCRPGKKEMEERRDLLLASLAHGAAFIDIEHDAREDYRRCISQTAKKAGSRLILSYHNDKRTPAPAEIRKIIRRSFARGADLVKVACKVNAPRDSARLFGLLGDPTMKGRLIVLGVGRSGLAVRILAPFFGSPFTYASFAAGKETAPGQLPFRQHLEIHRQLKKILKEAPWTSMP